MGVQKERDEFEEVFPCSTGTVLNECGHYESQVNHKDAMIQNISWVVWQAAKAQAVPDGFVVVPIDKLAIAAQNIRELNNGEYYSEEIEENVCTIEAILAPQEQK